MQRRPRKLGMELLLEVMLGLCIFLFALLGVCRLFPSADAAAVHGEKVAQATQLCRQLLEGQLAQEYDQIQPVSGTGQVQFASRRGTNMVLDYTYQVDVQQIGTQKLKSISATVKWWTGSGITKCERTVRLDTIKGVIL